MLGYEEALTREFPLPSSHQSQSQSHSPTPTAYYNTSAHFLWIGDRTRQLDGAHVEYFRGIRNPIGIKVGPSMKNDELVQLLNSKQIFCSADVNVLINVSKVVNPDKESGKVTLITRYGAAKVKAALLAIFIVKSRLTIQSQQVEQYLPGHIAAVQESGHPVIWISDPMHGKYDTSYIAV